MGTEKITENEPFVSVKRMVEGKWKDYIGQWFFVPRRVFVCRGCDGKGYMWIGSASDPDEPTQDPCQTCNMTGELLEGTREADQLILRGHERKGYRGGALL